MTLASVQGETFLIPVGATGVLSTLTNWQHDQNADGQKVVDLTEMIDKRLLRSARCTALAKPLRGAVFGLGDPE